MCNTDSSILPSRQSPSWSTSRSFQVHGSQRFCGNHLIWKAPTVLICSDSQFQICSLRQISGCQFMTTASIITWDADLRNVQYWSEISKWLFRRSPLGHSTNDSRFFPSVLVSHWFSSSLVMWPANEPTSQPTNHLWWTHPLILQGTQRFHASKRRRTQLLVPAARGLGTRDMGVPHIPRCRKLWTMAYMRT